MKRLQAAKMIVAMATLAAALSGCADNRLNGGYTGDEKHSMTYIGGQVPAENTKLAQSDTTNYVYRGGRDPVTGKAYLRN